MKDNKVFLHHIIDEMNFLLKESENLKYEQFAENEVLKRAFFRSLEVIGEATKNLSKEFREIHSQIDWKELTGLRDKLIHKYFGIRLKRVWDVVKDMVPELKAKLEAIL